MNISILVAILTSASAALFSIGPDASSPEQHFCKALSEARPGAAIEVELTGVLVRGRIPYFYDPDEPQCFFDLQPASAVEFAPGAERPPGLEELLRREWRALVTLEGTIFGPKAPGPDDPSIPVMASFSMRNADRRYGGGRFRTQMLVTKVVSVDEVPADFAEPPTIFRVTESPPAYEIVVPRYPGMARHIGLQGDVVVRAIVEDGRVTSARLLQGDRLFESATLEAVREWRTDAGVDEELDIVFAYRLEQRLRGSSPDPRIEVLAPHFVKITAATNGW
jgi:TonB family protein